MKTRHGFVSNSSSTSFTCNVCGEEYSGMNMGLCDFYMVECINGHIFCEDHSINLGKDEANWRYNIPAAQCPICSFQIAYLPDKAKYLLKQSGQTERELLMTLADIFGSYQAFKEFIK